MDTLLVMLSFVAFILAVIGTIQPRLAFWKGERSRKKIGLSYLLLSFALFIGFGITTDSIDAKNPTVSKENDATTDQAKTQEDYLLIVAQAISASDYQGNIDAYTELLGIDPENKMYADKVAHYTELLKKKPKAALLPEFTIIERTDMPPHKQAYIVRLEGRVSLVDLKRIGMKIHSKRGKEFDRTFINYLLSGMPDSQASWATTHFNPEMKAVIQGATIEQASAMAAMPLVKPGQELIGAWELKGILSARIVMYTENNVDYLDWRFKDGSNLLSKMKSKKISRGKGYESDPNDGTDWYLINKNGELELHDEYGLSETVKKVKQP